MYFRSRADAGRQLAVKLEQYKNQNISVVALSEGAVIVAAQIAMKLHGNLMLLLTENIYLPGEKDAIASMSSTGTFSYNNMFTAGQLEELTADYHQYIDQKRREKMHELNVLIGHEGEIHPEYLRHHTVILVSDGLPSGASLDVAEAFLKTIAIKKLIIATPNASVPAVDKMHLIGDEICCLNVVANYLDINHYYDDNTVPKTHDLFKMMQNISLHWSKEEQMLEAGD
ncbi:MAG: phosphoribosyltransferase family protein [Candidatus Saccharibacteria bacterium]|nr:phosphoribosyltransferase family protein [Candidatus Saccharibacteria bacterium]